MFGDFDLKDVAVETGQTLLDQHKINEESTRKAQREWIDWKRKKDYEDRLASDKETRTRKHELFKLGRTQFFDMVKGGNWSQQEIGHHATRLLKNGKISPTDFYLAVHKRTQNPEKSMQVLEKLSESMGNGKLNVNPYASFEEFNKQFPKHIWERWGGRGNKRDFYNNITRVASKNMSLAQAENNEKRGVMSLKLANNKSIELPDPYLLSQSAENNSSSATRMAGLLTKIGLADASIAGFLRTGNPTTDDIQKINAYKNRVNALFNQYHKTSDLSSARGPNASLDARNNRLFRQTAAASEELSKQNPKLVQRINDDNEQVASEAVKQYNSSPQETHDLIDIFPAEKFEEKLQDPEGTLQNIRLISSPSQADGHKGAKYINWDNKGHVLKHASVFSIDVTKFDDALQQQAVLQVKPLQYQVGSPEYKAALLQAKEKLKIEHKASFIKRQLSEVFQKYHKDPKKSRNIFDNNFYTNLERLAELDDTFDPVAALEEAVYLATPTHHVIRSQEGHIETYAPIVSGDPSQGLRVPLFGKYDDNGNYKMHEGAALNPQISLKNVNSAVGQIDEFLTAIDIHSKLQSGNNVLAATGKAADIESWIGTLKEETRFLVAYAKEFASKETFLKGGEAKHRERSTSLFLKTVESLDKRRSDIIRKYENAETAVEKARYAQLANIQSMKIRFAYRLSGMLQGEGQGGGRTISDVDFQNALIAIAGTPKQMEVKLRQLKKEWVLKQKRLQSALQYDRTGKLPAIDAVVDPLRTRMSRKMSEEFVGFENALYPPIPSSGNVSYKNEKQWAKGYYNSLQDIRARNSTEAIFSNENINATTGVLSKMTEKIFIDSGVLDKVADEIISNPKISAESVVQNRERFDDSTFNSFINKNDFNDKVMLFSQSLYGAGVQIPQTGGGLINSILSIDRNNDDEVNFEGRGTPYTLINREDSRLDNHYIDLTRELLDQALINALKGIIAERTLGSLQPNP